VGQHGGNDGSLSPKRNCPLLKGGVDLQGPKSNLAGWERGVPKPKFGVNE